MNFTQIFALFSFFILLVNCEYNDDDGIFVDLSLSLNNKNNNNNNFTNEKIHKILNLTKLEPTKSTTKYYETSSIFLTQKIEYFVDERTADTKNSSKITISSNQSLGLFNKILQGFLFVLLILFMIAFIFAINLLLIAVDYFPCFKQESFIYFLKKTGTCDDYDQAQIVSGNCKFSFDRNMSEFKTKEENYDIKFSIRANQNYGADVIKSKHKRKWSTNDDNDIKCEESNEYSKSLIDKEINSTPTFYASESTAVIESINEINGLNDINTKDIEIFTEFYKNYPPQFSSFRINETIKSELDNKNDSTKLSSSKLHVGSLDKFEHLDITESINNINRLANELKVENILKNFEEIESNMLDTIKSINEIHKQMCQVKESGEKNADDHKEQQERSFDDQSNGSLSDQPRLSNSNEPNECCQPVEINSYNCLKIVDQNSEKEDQNLDD